MSHDFPLVVYAIKILLVVVLGKVNERQRQLNLNNMNTEYGLFSTHKYYKQFEGHNSKINCLKVNYQWSRRAKHRLVTKFDLPIANCSKNLLPWILRHHWIHLLEQSIFFRLSWSSYSYTWDIHRFLLPVVNNPCYSLMELSIDNEFWMLPLTDVCFIRTCRCTLAYLSLSYLGRTCERC